MLLRESTMSGPLLSLPRPDGERPQPLVVREIPITQHRSGGRTKERAVAFSASEILRALESTTDAATREAVASLNLLLLFIYEDNGRIIVCSTPLEFWEYDSQALTLRPFVPEELKPRGTDARRPDSPMRARGAGSRR